MSTDHSHLFRVSLYAALCLATFGLWMGEDNALPYPWLVVFCSVAAYAFTDMWGMMSIPSALDPWLGAAAVGFLVREELATGKIDPVMPLGHLIIIFQIILLFHTKTPRSYWLLLLTSFLQILIAALHNNRLAFGFLVGAFLALMVWTMTRFLLLRESQRYAPIAVRAASRSRLKRSVAGSFAASTVIFCGAMLLFLVIPRRGQTAWTQSATRPGQYLSGFDERIRLGQLGTILESDEEVMTVRLLDEKGQPFRLPDEPYWRGVALTYYDGGRWERRLDIEPVSLLGVEVPAHYVRQEIRLQGVHRDVLFGMWPAVRGQTRSGEPLGKFIRDGTLVRPESLPPGPLQYIVDSIPSEPVSFRRELEGPFRYENEREDRLRELTQVPQKLALSLRDYVARRNLIVDPNPDAVCRSLLEHLQDPNEFDYTLRITQTDPGIDPVLDFLVNRKEGHCEYFASALTLLLRAHGVPSRVINGFKGGDWNDLFGPTVVVRQKHAHSWVEVLMPIPGRSELHWIVLDPTPGAGRQRVVSMVHPTPNLLRQVSDISRQVWSSYVLNFNSSEQEAAVYGPLRRTVVQQSRNFTAWVRQVWAARSRTFNWLAAAAASLTTLALLIGMRVAWRLISAKQPAWPQVDPERQLGMLGRVAEFMRSMWRRWAAGNHSMLPRVPFYDELLRNLDALGIHKQATWTARQFASYAETELARMPPPVTRIPSELVDRYYRVRFGEELLNASEVAEVTQMLATLADVVRSNRATVP